MTNKPKVSIIIPVYGVEQYISKCIESIKAQTFTDFEAILVNDGTKDNTVVVAEETIAGDERFIIYHKENGGQGSARNLGLDKARGDYIAFIDSDDWVEPDYLQAMYEKIVIEDADICTCDVNLISSGGILQKVFKSNPEKYYLNRDYLNGFFYISNWMCDKLFKKEVFNGMRFDPEVRTFEDAHFVFRLIYKRKITSVRCALYNYIQHFGSTSNDVKPSYLKDRIAVYQAQIDFANRHGIDSEQYLLHMYLKTFLFFCMTTLARYSSDYGADIEKLKNEIDYQKFTIKNIFLMIEKEKKVGFSLLLFKMSPTAFRVFARFWFRNHLA
ncbi:MAG: glycosyltransferase family 2 protein [Methyloprofundus sp.]|nr:glycosyltransferase family 2 protein [Methyloprofundus sp.]